MTHVFFGKCTTFFFFFFPKRWEPIIEHVSKQYVLHIWAFASSGYTHTHNIHFPPHICVCRDSAWMYTHTIHIRDIGTQIRWWLRGDVGRCKKIGKRAGEASHSSCWMCSKKKKKMQKKEEMYTTSCGSTVVTHLSTRQTDSGLTSQIGRDAVHFTTYGRIQRKEERNT